MWKELGGHHGYGRRCLRRDHFNYEKSPLRFLAKEDQKLGEYAQELENEPAVVQEHVQELRTKQ
jgi:hypothetical protein